MKDLLDRLSSKFLIGDECWPWTGGRTSGGYGSVRSGQKSELAHRVVYELFNGPIPDGLTLDHLCHSNDPSCQGGPSCPHRACVRPSHLEPTTMLVNYRRGRAGAHHFDGSRARTRAKTHCKHGHEFTPDNTIKRHGQRQCRACHRAAERRRRERRARPTP